MSLTNDQEKLVNENIKLAYYMANRWHRRITNYDIPFDEIASECLLALVIAANTYKYDKGVKFHAYAMRIMDNQVLMLIRKAKKKRDEISIDEMIEHTNDEGERGKLWDSIEYEIAIDNIAEWLKYEIVHDALLKLKLKPKEKDILKLRFLGLSQKDIGKIKGICRSSVSKILKTIKEKVNRELRR